MASPWPQSPACVWSRQCLAIAASPPLPPPPPIPPGDTAPFFWTAFSSCLPRARVARALAAYLLCAVFGSCRHSPPPPRCTHGRGARKTRKLGQRKEGTWFQRPVNHGGYISGQRRNGGLVTRERSMVVTVNHMAAAPACSSPPANGVTVSVVEMIVDL